MLEQITKDAKSNFGYSSWAEFLKSEECQKIKERYNQGKIKVGIKGVEALWVKKLVSVSRFNNFYSQIGSYCLLEKKDGGYIIGFPVVGGIPRDCQMCEDDDLWKIGNHRKSQNIFPNPLEEKPNEEIKVGQLSL